MNASLSIHAKTLFSDPNLTINRGDQLGIVGDNGAGKSSLLRSIAKQQDEHGGDIIHARGLRCLYVEQGYFQRQRGVNNHSGNASQKAKKIERRVKSLEADMPIATTFRKQDITLAADELNVKKFSTMPDLLKTLEIATLKSPMAYLKNVTRARAHRVVVHTLSLLNILDTSTDLYHL